MKWINFLRKYGPISRNDNMYDETIYRSAQKMHIKPIVFDHPFKGAVCDCFCRPQATDPVSVILTGTAGDGKTHLCREVWKILKKNDDDWISDNPYLKISFKYPLDRKNWPIDSNGDLRKDDGLYRNVMIHVIRDLSGWAPQQGQKWEPGKLELIHKFCNSLFDADASDIFLIAGNDGQLIETFRRLDDSPLVKKTREVLEEFLVEGKERQDGIRLRFFNLSSCKSLELFKLAIDKFLNHPGWQECYNGNKSDDEAFSARCPIRHNYELLQTELVRSRLESLFNLCDHIGLHIPVRQILILLTNAVLGHPDVKDYVMVPGDVPRLLREGKASRANLFDNIFGGNLPVTRRQGITVFEYLDRFQVGYETSNRIDNIILYGDMDTNLAGYYDELIKRDSYYNEREYFLEAKRNYIEGVDESVSSQQDFLQLLIRQRRGLFFKIPRKMEKELRMWELTVFKFAGEYISEVVNAVEKDSPVDTSILSRLVKGLNRIFTGMLINNDEAIILATSGSYSQAKISRILLERISVRSSKGEKVVIKKNNRYCPNLIVQLSPDIVEPLDLNLVRYEFLSRVAADGALPASFSKECFEDILAFKSNLIDAWNRRENNRDENVAMRKELRILKLSDQGSSDDTIEVRP